MTKHPVPPPQYLRCEALTDPLGLDERQPELSWRLGDSSRRGVRQRAYQILVASTPEILASNQGDVWDSGKVSGGQSTQVAYGGVPLASRQRCHWKVRVWDTAGASPWSAPALWEMGLLEPADWQAGWLAAPPPAEGTGPRPSPFFRRRFTLAKPVVRARLYVTALGWYEAWLNGRRVGERFFTPGYTDFAQRLPYQVYDVTGLVTTGENALGAILADGWYCRGGKRKDLLLSAQLELTHADGSRTTVVTDGQWRTATGPLLQADLDKGETYDEGLEVPGWCEAAFDDRAWTPARPGEAPTARLCATMGPPVRRIQELRPVKLTSAAPDRHVFDLGQNMVGWVRLRVPAGLPPGTRLVLRHAEMLNPDGTLYVANLRGAASTDTFITGGADRPARDYEPRFTFHGFRYVELSGLAGSLDLDTVTGVVVHSDTPPSGSFACSQSLLNQLQSNITWSQKGNFLEVPTDCPQRDERVGWTGDAQVFIPTACFNMDVQAFFRKWGRDLLDAQQPNGTYPSVVPYPGWSPLDGGAAWADAGVVVPWVIYRCYGDRRILAEHYSAMARYVEFLQATPPRTRFCFGDWLNLNDGTGGELLGVACAARVTRLLARIATVLGRADDAKRFKAYADGWVARFRREFVTPSGRVQADSQTAFVLALVFDLLPARQRPAAGAYLVERLREHNMHLSTGFVGTPYLLDALTQIGRLDLAYALLQEATYPSWLYQITQGATTIWERWDSWHHERGFQDPSMTSFNHYAYGAVGDWMYRHIGGIDLDERIPGYRHAVIRPQPGGGITWAKASLQTPHGLLVVQWKTDAERFSLDVTVPANSTATVHLPAGPDATVTESGRPLGQGNGVSAIQRAAHETRCRIGSGRYSFEVSGYKPLKPGQ